MSRRRKLALCFAMMAAAATAVAIPLCAQEGGKQRPARDPVLGFLALSGNKASVQSFLKALQPGEGSRKSADRRLTLFVPDIEQIYQFGNRDGAVAFAGALPPGSKIQLMVREADSLKSFGDRASTLTFLETLASRDCVMELWILDLPGLARVGHHASVLRFVEGLPPGSSIHLFTNAREIQIHGDTAAVIAFLSAPKCRLEVRLDDPLLDVYLAR